MKSSDTACRNIRAASSESEVIRAVSEYLQSLAPAALALLPTELMALGLRQAEEAIHSALETMDRQMARAEGPEADALNETVLVLSTAARRLATLAKNTA